MLSLPEFLPQGINTRVLLQWLQGEPVFGWIVEPLSSLFDATACESKSCLLREVFREINIWHFMPSPQTARVHSLKPQSGSTFWSCRFCKENFPNYDLLSVSLRESWKDLEATTEFTLACICTDYVTFMSNCQSKVDFISERKRRATVEY